MLLAHVLSITSSEVIYEHLSWFHIPVAAVKAMYLLSNLSSTVSPT